MKPKHQRLLFVAASVLCLIAASLITLNAFRDNIVFFYGPSELAAKPPSAHAQLRIGGLVEQGSVMHDADNTLHFNVTDGKAAIPVTYRGLPPSLFREGQGVVAEGKLDAGGVFQASRILAKHDENYMPREVVDALKASGRWQEGGEASHKDAPP